MPDFAVWEWALLAGFGLLVGVSKTGMPGIGILGVVLLLWLMESEMSAAQAVGFMLPMLIAGDLCAVAYYRRRAEWRTLLRLMPWAALGIVIGWQIMWLLKGAEAGTESDILLRRIIGGIVVALLALDLWRNTRKALPQIPTQWWVAGAVGVVAGITTTLSNAAGPLIVIYFAAMQFEKQKFIGTAAWYFLALNCFKIPFFIDLDMMRFDLVKAGLMLVPAIVAGACIGVLVLRRIPQKWFVIVVKTLAAAGAVKLLMW